jgi:hypothetical protein
MPSEPKALKPETPKVKIQADNEPDNGSFIDMKPLELNGKQYYSLKQFSRATNRHTSHISLLFSHGNKVRRLKGIRVSGKPFIEVTEVDDFPFKGLSSKEAQREKGFKDYSL